MGVGGTNVHTIVNAKAAGVVVLELPKLVVVVVVVLLLLLAAAATAATPPPLRQYRYHCHSHCHWSLLLLLLLLLLLPHVVIASFSATYYLLLTTWYDHYHDHYFRDSYHYYYHHHYYYFYSYSYSSSEAPPPPTHPGASDSYSYYRFYFYYECYSQPIVLLAMLWLFGLWFCYFDFQSSLDILGNPSQLLQSKRRFSIWAIRMIFCNLSIRSCCINSDLSGIWCQNHAAKISCLECLDCSDCKWSATTNENATWMGGNLDWLKSFHSALNKEFHLPNIGAPEIPQRTPFGGFDFPTCEVFQRRNSSCKPEFLT